MEIYLWTPRLSMALEMHGRAINELRKVLMSFIISAFILIEKPIELDKMTLFMSYSQLWISHDKKIKAIIILGYVGSPT